MTEATPTPGETPAEPVVAVLKKVAVASGEEVVLQPDEIAVLVTFDQRTGQPAVYDVQNCPLRAYSKMLLNEALNLYSTLSIANSTAKVIDELQDKKKKGLFQR